MAENKPPHPKYISLMEKAEETLDEALSIAQQGPSGGETADRFVKIAETYRDFSAMFRGSGF